jgi:hypothetical protein
VSGRKFLWKNRSFKFKTGTSSVRVLSPESHLGRTGPFSLTSFAQEGWI